ncbi:MAG: elongation factor G [Pseudomonadota bacterium]
MAKRQTANIRNIALVGHSGSGKTTLAETLLHRSGTLKTPGSIDRGSTVCDFEPQEKELKHSVDTALCFFEHNNIHVNLIDTPGYPDLAGRSVSILPAVETVAVVINAQMGIELITQKMMEIAEHRNLCRMIIINKIDSPGVDLHSLLREVRQTFGNVCLPMNLPAANGTKVEDCYFSPSGEATDFASVEAAHTEIIDQVVEVDEELMELYLEQGEDLAPEQLHDPFEKALREGHLVPVCFTSVEKGVGLDQLLRVFEELMPNPMEGNPPPFEVVEDDKTEPVAISGKADDHIIAHVFKIAIDPYVGRLGLFRIHQGTITPNSQLFIGSGRKAFKVNHIYQMQGKQHTELTQAVPGDICAVAKVDELNFDDVLHDSHEEDHFHLHSMERQPLMYGLAIEPAQRGTEQKLSDALHKLAAEDPSLNLEHNITANETVLRGMGDLHLRLVMEKMKAQYGVEITTHLPSIEYRETITSRAEGHHRHKKQTGGAGQFGEVFLKVEPLPRDEGFEFVNKVVGGTIPSQFIPAVEKGVRDVLDHGAISGHPMQDVRVTVYDGKHHSVDSKEVAFVAAGRKAFIDAIQKARPKVLEPIAKIKIIAPNDSMGDITGNLSSLRGRISGNTSLPGNRITISGEVPISEMGDFQSKLKSLTGGEGAFTMEFSHYEEVPPQTQKQLVDNHASGTSS